MLLLETSYDLNQLFFNKNNFVICPQCKNTNIKVLESRDTEDGLVIRRRRECDSCKYRFTTFERIESMNFLVIKKNKTREPYNRNKLIQGIWIACSKRPVKQNQIDTLISQLEQKWMGMGQEIATSIIGQDVMKALKKLDEIAYIRFSSVYKNFKDIETFREELVEFLKNN